MQSVLKIEAPIKTVSEMNQREHWTARNRRRVKQRKAIYFAWKVGAAGKRKLGVPCTVKLTRLGKNLLDDDNLRGAFKFVRDQVAELLGVDDADAGITFEYDQKAGEKYGVVIEVFV